MTQSKLNIFQFQYHCKDVVTFALTDTSHAVLHNSSFSTCMHGQGQDLYSEWVMRMKFEEGLCLLSPGWGRGVFAPEIV